MRNRLETAVSVALMTACLLVGANAGLSLWARLRPAARPADGRGGPLAQPLPKDPITIEDPLTVGDAKAPVVVIEFSDYQCPFCERFERDTWTALNDTYVKQGRVRWIYRHLPLESIHTAAFASAEAAECAAAQGRFPEFHALLFKERQHLDPASLSRYAQEANLNADAFAACMQGAARAKVRHDMESASALGVTGTPSFILGTREPDGRIRLRDRLVGAVPAAQFQAAIDKALAAAPAGH